MSQPTDVCLGAVSAAPIQPKGVFSDMVLTWFADTFFALRKQLHLLPQRTYALGFTSVRCKSVADPKAANTLLQSLIQGVYAEMRAGLMLA